MGFASFLIACLAGATLRMMGYAFVDNTDLCFTGQDNHQLAAHLLPQFQQAVDCWEGLLRATGGGLEHSKTFWCLIDHKWDSATCQWRYHSMEDTQGVISIRKAGEDTRVNLRGVEPWEANKILGVWMAMDGNQEAEVEYLRARPG